MAVLSRLVHELEDTLHALCCRDTAELSDRRSQSLRRAPAHVGINQTRTTSQLDPEGRDSLNAESNEIRYLLIQLPGDVVGRSFARAVSDVAEGYAAADPADDGGYRDEFGSRTHERGECLV